MGATAEDTFKILIATDNHLGYAEKDTERGEDSFETFEEILELAVEKEVDMILLGGDLFHENKPSRQCIVRCMDLLRKYTYGDRPVLFDFVSDPVENFKHAKNPIVNYQDPNLNVSIPVFSIHGNHDDPSGMGQFCALEMLSTAGLINYFGRTTDLTEINISPILLEKGRTRLAMYGLSSIKDERLFRLFSNDKVKMLRPLEAMDEWFNIFVLHQNHTKHGMTNYIPEAFLDPFLDLVIWGHEHECLIDPRQSAEDSFFVVQPGSSVATSLCGGESAEKHVAILEVTHEKKFKVDKHKLKTVRPFVFEDLCLADHGLGEKGELAVKSYVENHVREMLKKAKGLLTGHPRQPKKPLIRLRVEYSHGDQMFNTVRFGHTFEELVANPNDMILFKKEVQQKKKVETGVDDEVMDALFDNTTRVEDLVKNYFDEVDDSNRQLSLLTERGLALSVQSYTEKEDSRALIDIVKHQIKKSRKYLLEADVEPEDDQVLQKIHEYRDERLEKKKAEELEDEAAAVLNDPNRNRSKHRIESSDDDDIIDDTEVDNRSTRPSRGRGSRGPRARGGRGSRAAAASAGSSRASSAKGQLELTSINSPIGSGSKSQRGRGRGRGQSVPRQSNIMDSFSRASQRTSQSTSFSAKKKTGGVVFDSDFDSD